MSDKASSFPAAGLDSDGRKRLLFFMIAMAVVAVFMLWGLGRLSEQAPTVAGLVVVVSSIFAVLIPVFAVGGLPTDFIVDGDVLRIKRRWRGDKTFKHEGRAEVFADAGALRRRKFYGSGKPLYSFIVTATTDLPGGDVYFALTDRERAVLVHGEEGPVLVSPADPDAFIRAVGDADA